VKFTNELCRLMLGWQYLVDSFFDNLAKRGRDRLKTLTIMDMRALVLQESRSDEGNLIIHEMEDTATVSKMIVKYISDLAGFLPDRKRIRRPRDLETVCYETISFFSNQVTNSLFRIRNIRTFKIFFRNLRFSENINKNKLKKFLRSVENFTVHYPRTMLHQDKVKMVEILS